MTSNHKANATNRPLSRRGFGAAAVGVAGMGVASFAGVSESSPYTLDDPKESTVSAPEGYEGNIAVCTMLIVKDKMEKETDAVWDKHKAWLRESHGPWGMVSYTVAKHKELKFPLKPGNGETTDRIVYCIHEIYRNIEGLQKHYQECEQGDYIREFMKICTTEGNSFTVLQGAPVTHSLLPKDCAFPVELKK